MRILRISISVLILFLWGCSSHEDLEPPDNPFDPGNPDYVSPQVIIIDGPQEGESVDTTSVTFMWEGNESATEFQHRLDSGEWSGWSDGTSQTFDYLDEGTHSFQVEARSVNGDEQEQYTLLDFEVDAVTGPSVLVYPYKQSGFPGDTLVYQVIAEEVTDVFANECKIYIDNDNLELIEVIHGGILSEWGGTSLMVEDFSDSVLSISMVAAEGSSISFSGTCSLVTLLFRINPLAITGTSFEVVRVTDIKYLNPEMDNLVVNTNRVGVLHVQ